jgi:hypothetical protein
MTKTEKILSVAKKLCKANNTVTTLEIKTELRKRYPKNRWEQTKVSLTMSDASSNGKFDYVDNGTFRTYSLVGKVANKGTLVAPVSQLGTPTTSTITGRVKKVKAPKAPMTTQKISRTKALDLIQNSNGKFFTVTFIKKDGSRRVLNGQYTPDMGVSPLGYILVKDISAVRKKEVKTVKNVNLQTIESIRLDNVLSKID